MSTTNWPRTDSEITFSGAYKCTHHNDGQRAACPVCLVAALTAERDQLHAEVANQAARFHDEIVSRQGTVRANQELDLKERDQLRADNSTLRAAQKACEACDEPPAFEVRQLRARAEKAEAELAAERARLDYLLQWDVTFHDRADIDAELSYGQRKKSTPTLP